MFTSDSCSKQNLQSCGFSLLLFNNFCEVPQLQQVVNASCSHKHTPSFTVVKQGASSNFLFMNHKHICLLQYNKCSFVQPLRTISMNYKTLEYCDVSFTLPVQKLSTAGRWYGVLTRGQQCSSSAKTQGVHIILVAPQLRDQLPIGYVPDQHNLVFTCHVTINTKLNCNMDLPQRLTFQRC